MNPLRSRVDSYVPSPLSHLLIVCAFVSLCFLSTTTLTFYCYYIYLHVSLLVGLWPAKLLVSVFWSFIEADDKKVEPKVKYEKVRKGVYKMEGWKQTGLESLYCAVKEQWDLINDEPLAVFDPFKLH